MPLPLPVYGLDVPASGFCFDLPTEAQSFSLLERARYLLPLHLRSPSPWTDTFLGPPVLLPVSLTYVDSGELLLVVPHFVRSRLPTDA